MIAAGDSVDSTAFIGHLQNFFVDTVDVIDLLRRHVTAADGYAPPTEHSVLSHSGTLTDRLLPIPVHPVTLMIDSSVMPRLRLPTIDLSHGNATLKLMFQTRVSKGHRLSTA